MSKPANLEYAFPVTDSVIVASGQTCDFVAYRVTSGQYSFDDYNFWDQARTLQPHADLATDDHDGDVDGEPGTYIVFGYRSDHYDPHYASREGVVADIGWDPFDPINHTPTSVRYWELQPGSDVMATTLGVLPKVGDYPYDGGSLYMGLVTVAANSPVPAEPPFGPAQAYWYLDPVETAASIAGDNAAATAFVPDDTPTPGVYLAVYYSADGQPPLAFPAGWTPGNTTGSGPVLPLLGSFPNESPVYGGLVITTEPQPYVTGDWYLLRTGAPATFEAYGSNEWYGGSGTDEVDVPPGLHVAVYNPAPGGPVPTAFPTGWTFRPYGLGPVAITDENAGGVIGDVAYVVSGYVYNAGAVFGPALPNWRGILAADTTTALAVGDHFSNPPNANGVFVCTGAGDLVVHPDGSIDGLTSSAVWGSAAFPDYAWPFLERYNLRTKTWLPRIPMPIVGDSPNAVNGSWEPDTSYGLGATKQYDHLNYVSTVEETTPDAAPDATPGEWDRLSAPVPYAAEGGFAGVINGKLYFGGGDGDNITGAEFFVFDPVTEEFTRLPDVPSGVSLEMDYAPYGVVAGSLYGLGSVVDFGSHSTIEWIRYTPSSGWSTGQFDYSRAGDLPPFPYDQIQGVEIGGKLYFVYDRVYVFDPVALTVEAKAALPVGATSGSSAAARSGKVLYTSGSGGTFEYDPVTDLWSDTGAAGNVQNGYSVAVQFKGAYYFVSGVYDNDGNVSGVYGLTGNQPDVPSYTAPDTVRHLVHRGFTWRQAAALQSAETSDSFRELLRAGFSPRQARTLLRGNRSLKALERGGFTPAQAKALEA